MDGDNQAFHVLVVGDENVGKHSICSTYLKGYHSEDLRKSVESNRKEVTLGDETYFLDFHIASNVKGLSDGGDKVQSRLEQLPSDLSPHAILMVYDVTNKRSFESISRHLHTLEVMHRESQTPKAQLPIIALVGNKSDLAEEQNVSIEDAEQLSANTSEHCCFRQPSTYETCVNQSDSHLLLTEIFNSIVEILVEKKGKKGKSLGRTRSSSAMVASTHRASIRLYNALSGLSRKGSVVAMSSSSDNNSITRHPSDLSDSDIADSQTCSSPRSYNNSANFEESHSPRSPRTPRSKSIAGKFMQLVKKVK